MKQFFQKKSISFYLSFSATLFALIGLGLYLITMQLQNNMAIAIVIISILGIIMGLVTCIFKDYLGLLTILSASFYLLAGLLFIVIQAENIGYAIYETNIGDGIMPTFVASVICYVIAMIVGTAAAFTCQKK